MKKIKIIHNKKEWWEKAIYFSQYIGCKFGTQPGGHSHRIIFGVTGGAVYYGDTYFSGSWAHIDNCFLWLKHLEDLTMHELQSVYVIMYPDDAIPMRRKIVINKLREGMEPEHCLEFCRKNLYTISVHKKLIELQAATNFLGGKDFKLTSVQEIVKMKWVASREEIDYDKKYYAEKLYMRE